MPSNCCDSVAFSGFTTCVSLGQLAEHTYGHGPGDEAHKFSFQTTTWCIAGALETRQIKFLYRAVCQRCTALIQGNSG